MTPLSVPRRPRCHCGSPTRLRRGEHGHFYACARWPDCDGAVGCHPGTMRPLGTVADAATREARVRAHEALDPLWRALERDGGVGRGRARAAAYAWLGERLGIPDPHVGEMDRRTAEQTAAVCRAASPAVLRTWVDHTFRRYRDGRLRHLRRDV